MTIHVSKEVETAIKAAVQSGRFASADEMITRLVSEDAERSQAPKQTRRSATRTRRAKPTDSPKRTMTKAEFHQQLMADGLITRLPDPAQDIDDDDPEDQPIVIKGERLSETIIRERR